MPYTISQIKEMREKITPGDWETLTDLDTGLSDIHSNNDSEVVAMNMRENDADFLCAAPSIISQLLQEREELKKGIEGMKKTPTKHDGCNLDDAWCYNHNEIMEDGDRPNGAYAYNQALSDVLALFKD